jgi:A/G-specific adenine glycosylase
MEEDSTLKKFVKDAQVVSKKYKHVLSHQIIHATFIIIKSDASSHETENLKYYSAKKIAALPKPVLISRFLEDHQLI